MECNDNIKIKVVVRKRPLSQKEIEKNDIDIIEKRTRENIVVKEPKYKLLELNLI